MIICQLVGAVWEDLDWARAENVFALVVAIKCHINEEFLVISRNVRNAEP